MMRGLCEELYAGFMMRHFHEDMKKRHHHKLGCTVTWLFYSRQG